MASAYFNIKRTLNRTFLRNNHRTEIRVKIASTLAVINLQIKTSRRQLVGIW